MKVRDVMAKNVTTIYPDTSFGDLWKAIFKTHINAVPVVDKKNKLIGIVAKEDILKRLYPGYEELIENFASAVDSEEMEEKIHEIVTLTAKDVMSRRVIYTRAETPIMRALSRMIVRRVNQLPVLSGTDGVIGMVTKGDIFYALFSKHLNKKNAGHHGKTAQRHRLKK